MNKKTFLIKLEHELRRLPSEDRKNAIQYYIEYFDEAGVENEQAVIDKLGTPKEVAKQILSEFAVKHLEEEQVVVKRRPISSPKWVKWVVIGIITSPVTVPLAMFVALCVVAIVFVAFAAVALLGGVALCAVIAGVFLAVVAIAMLFSDFLFGLVCLGVVLVLLSLALSFTQLAYLTAKGAVRAVNSIIKTVSAKTLERKANKHVENDEE